MKTPPTPRTPSRPAVVVFAAIDGSGGAGVLADCRTLHAAGCLPLAVTTAVTAQNLDGVIANWPLLPVRVHSQFTALLRRDAGQKKKGRAGQGRTKPLLPAAIKIGVVGRAAATIAADLKPLAHTHNIPIVWDPVLAPTSGGAFVAPAATAAVARHLLPVASIITPNRRELLALTGERRISAAAAAIFAAGCRAVLVTDIDGRGANVRCALLTPDSTTPQWESTTPRRAALYHGSGCLFSSHLAARLAHGDPVPKAAAAAQSRVCAAMTRAIAMPALGRQRLMIE